MKAIKMMTVFLKLAFIVWMSIVIYAILQM